MNLLGSPWKADLRSDSQLLYSKTSLFQRSLVISEALNLTPLWPVTGLGQSELGSPSLSYESELEIAEVAIVRVGELSRDFLSYPRASSSALWAERRSNRSLRVIRAPD